MYFLVIELLIWSDLLHPWLLDIWVWAFRNEFQTHINYKVLVSFLKDMSILQALLCYSPNLLLIAISTLTKCTKVDSINWDALFESNTISTIDIKDLSFSTQMLNWPFEYYEVNLSNISFTWIKLEPFSVWLTMNSCRSLPVLTMFDVYSYRGHPICLRKKIICMGIFFNIMVIQICTSVTDCLIKFSNKST